MSGTRAVAHGGAPRGWIELSANLNPLGTPAAVRRRIAQTGYELYADLDASAAERRLAAEAGVPADHVLLTAGATEGLRLVCETAIERGDPVFVASPAYGELARAAARAGGLVREAALSDLRPSDTGAVLLCDPCNPTGAQLSAAALGRLLRTLRTGRLVVDQSFLPFGRPTLSARTLVARDAILVRSLTKVLAIPAVRVGYVIARPERIAAMRDARDPWSVGAHAIAAATAGRFALAARAARRIAALRGRFVAGLLARGFSVDPSAVNFVLARPPLPAAELAAHLARRKIAIRACADFGLPDQVRLAVRPLAEQRRFFAALP